MLGDGFYNPLGFGGKRREELRGDPIGLGSYGRGLAVEEDPFGNRPSLLDGTDVTNGTSGTRPMGGDPLALGSYTRGLEVGADPFGPRPVIDERRPDPEPVLADSVRPVMGNAWSVGANGAWVQDDPSVSWQVSGGKRYDVNDAGQYEQMMRERAGNLSLSVAERKAAQDAVSGFMADRARQDAIAADRQARAQAAALEVGKWQNNVDVVNAKGAQEAAWRREQIAAEAAEAQKKREAEQATAEQNRAHDVRKWEAEQAARASEAEKERAFKAGEWEKDRALTASEGEKDREIKREANTRPQYWGNGAYWDNETKTVKKIDNMVDGSMDSNGVYRDKNGELKTHPNLAAFDSQIAAAARAGLAFGEKENMTVKQLQEGRAREMARLKRNGSIPYSDEEKAAMEAEKAQAQAAATPQVQRKVWTRGE